MVEMCCLGRKTLAVPLSAVMFVVGISCANGAAESTHYELDPQHLTLGFLVTHVGFARVLGSFGEGSGSFDFDEETQELSNVRIVVKTASVVTGVPARDQHLRSADFLDVETHPEMFFEAERATFEDGKTTLDGELTLLGVTKPLSLSATWNKSDVSPLPGSPYVAGFSARGVLKRSDFGMSYGVVDGLVGDEVELIIELEAQRQ